VCVSLCGACDAFVSVCVCVHVWVCVVHSRVCVWVCVVRLVRSRVCVCVCGFVWCVCECVCAFVCLCGACVCIRECVCGDIIIIITVLRQFSTLARLRLKIFTKNFTSVYILGRQTGHDAS